MNKNFSLFLTIIFFNSLSAQNFSVSADKNNILYIGLDNPLSIATENYPCKSLIIKTDNGKVTGNSCHYTYSGIKIGKTEIIIFVRKNNLLHEIGRRSFRVKFLPNPIAMVGPSSGGEISKVVLKNQQFIRAELENFDIDIHFAIDSFTLCIDRVDTCLYKEIINRQENKFSDEVINALGFIKKGDTVIFKKIYARRPDHTVLLLAPIVFEITD